MAEHIEEKPLNLVALELCMTRERLMRLIQRGIVRGRMDPTRPASAGRWFVPQSEIDRLVAERAAKTA
jgi:hypothetical protein